MEFWSGAATSWRRPCSAASPWRRSCSLPCAQLFGGESQERTLVDTSAAPPLLAIGLTLAVNGIAFGLWLVLVGLEFLALGAFLLIRDRRTAQ